SGEVVVDHVGLGDPLAPAQFTRAVGAATWSTIGRTRQLNAVCDHPAIDFALQELILEANRILAGVTKILAIDEGLTEAASALPASLSSGGVQPAKEADRPAYSVPHQRFTLAQSEVRDLLMGIELYGNPDLAIREIYQNALDACRYRLAR